MWILELLRNNLLLTLRPWPLCQLPRAVGPGLGWVKGLELSKKSHRCSCFPLWLWKSSFYGWGRRSLQEYTQFSDTLMDVSQQAGRAKILIWWRNRSKKYKLQMDPNGLLGSQWFDSRKLAWVVLCNHEFLLDVVPQLLKRPRIETTEAMLGADNGNWWRWEWPLKT